MADKLCYFRQIEVGPMQNFAYLVGDPDKREAAVIDAAWDIPRIIGTAEADGFKITKALVTHYHQDHLGGDLFGTHIAGVAELLEQVETKVYIHKTESEFLSGLVGLSGTDVVEAEAGDVTQVGSVDVKFIHTPGHTPGSQCFLVGNSLIAGDTLFINSCGRVDLPGSSPEDMYSSLQTLAKLPDETVLYPGHNYASESQDSLGAQKRRNMYLHLSTKSRREFLDAMS